jgi:hypothetical protein
MLIRRALVFVSGLRNVTAFTSIIVSKTSLASAYFRDLRDFMLKTTSQSHRERGGMVVGFDL